MQAPADVVLLHMAKPDLDKTKSENQLGGILNMENNEAERNAEKQDSSVCLKPYVV